MWEYRELIFYKAYFDIKAEAARGSLGLLWWVVEPLLYLSALSVVFVVIRGKGDEDFLPFLFVGLVVWKWFAVSLSQGANSVVGHVGLMRQVYIPKGAFPLISLLVNTFKFLVVLVLLCLALILLHHYPSTSWIALPAVIAVQFLMLIGVTSILALVVCYLPDVKLIVDNSILFLFFLSGVLFDINRAPDGIREYLYLNPMVSIIENFRRILIEGEWPDWEALGYVLIVSLLLLFLGQFLLMRYDRKIPKVILR